MAAKNGKKRVGPGRQTPEFRAQQGKGRPKGCKNKFTTLKEAFLHAFEEIGHEDALVKYAKSRSGRGHFLSMVARMLPREIELGGKDGGPLTIIFEDPFGRDKSS